MHACLPLITAVALPVFSCPFGLVFFRVLWERYGEDKNRKSSFGFFVIFLVVVEWNKKAIVTTLLRSMPIFKLFCQKMIEWQEGKRMCKMEEEKCRYSRRQKHPSPNPFPQKWFADPKDGTSPAAPASIEMRCPFWVALPSLLSNSSIQPIQNPSTNFSQQSSYSSSILQLGLFYLYTATGAAAAVALQMCTHFAGVIVASSSSSPSPPPPVRLSPQPSTGPSTCSSSSHLRFLLLLNSVTLLLPFHQLCAQVNPLYPPSPDWRRSTSLKFHSFIQLLFFSFSFSLLLFFPLSCSFKLFFIHLSIIV
jgi:hypothetical protein